MANMTAPVVEPVDPAASPQPPAVDPANPPPATAAEPSAAKPVPDAILKIPAIQAVVAGAPAAVSMNLKGSEDRDEVKLVTEHQDALHAAGMMFYKSISGKVGVLFNALRIHPQDLIEADKAGKLLQVAPDFDRVNHEVSKMGLKHPALHATPPPAALPVPQSGQTPPQAASGMLPLVPPAPASVARKMAAQRILNMQAGSPTSGPAPGAGRIMNSVLRPAI